MPTIKQGIHEKVALLTQQRPVSRLFEMSIASQRVRQAFVLHNDERDAIGQRPIFVASASI
jgi:hypothetical protein